MGTGKYEGLEVVAWQDAENPLYTTGERRQMHGWATDGYPIVELCRLSDAKRAIAELREECERLREEVENKYREPSKNEVALEAERDTLAAENARLRAELEQSRDLIVEMSKHCNATALVADWLERNT